MGYKKIMILTVILSCILAISAVSAAENVTDDIVGVEESDFDEVGISDVASDATGENQNEDVIAVENIDETDVCTVKTDNAFENSEDSDLEKTDDANTNESDKLMVQSDDAVKENLQDNNQSDGIALKATENQIISKNIDEKNSKLSLIHSDAKVYLKYIKTRYNSGKYFHFGWSGYFTGYFKVCKGNSVYFNVYLSGYDRKLKFNLEDMSPGTYVAMLVDYSGVTLGKTKIVIVKSSSKIYVKSFSAAAKSKFYCYAYVWDKYTGRNYNGGTVKFKIGGKIYKAKLKNGVAVAKIKIPSKVKTYRCKATFSGGSNVRGKTTNFIIKVKKRTSNYKTITVPAKKYYITKKSGKFAVQTRIWDMWRHSIGYYKYIDTMVFKNGKQLSYSKYLTRYCIHGKWTKWMKVRCGTGHHRYPVYDNGLTYAKVQVKVHI